MNRVVKYWIYNSWPYSIDTPGMKDRLDVSVGEITVDESETYVKNGKLYYNLQCGHGTNVELLIDNQLRR